MKDTVGVKNPYLYRGYRYDKETGFYYLQSRYYNAEWGRFINGDDVAILQLTQGELLGANLFTYCVNNPVNYRDPSGYWPWFVHWGIIIGELLGLGSFIKSGAYIKGLIKYWIWLIPFLLLIQRLQ